MNHYREYETNRDGITGASTDMLWAEIEKTGQGVLKLQSQHSCAGSTAS